MRCNSRVSLLCATLLFPAGALFAATVGKPSFSPSPGGFSGSIKVTLSSATSGATVRYTVDGSTPTSKSTAYKNAITLANTTTVKAKAFKSGMTDSATASGTYTLQKAAAISATQPIIPTGSTVSSKCVQYRADLTGVVTLGSPQSGVSLRFRSDRASADTITQPTKATDSSGKATGRITTRRQGTARITAENADILTPSPRSVSFLQADWASAFSMTGYIIANEADYGGATIKNPPGLTGTWRREFLYGSKTLGGVLMQGSGQDLNGTIITIDWKKSGKPLSASNVVFTTAKCATTASGACATAGTTIAVDPTIVPLSASVNIASLGSRVAQDTGGAITGYRIDVFRGFGKAAMKGFNNFSGTVRYLSGGGSCN